MNPARSVVVSIFKNTANPQVAALRTGTWETFADTFRDPLPAATSKAELPLWAPVDFGPGGHRNLSNVTAVYALTLDVDEAPIPYAEDLKHALFGLRAVCYSSPSATARAPRWRAVIALSRPVTSEEYSRLWAYLTPKLPFRVGQASKDPSRQWYAACEGVDGSYDFISMTGAALDVDALLSVCPPSTVTSGPLQVGLASAPKNETRDVAARLLGASWPEKNRHQSQLALAGALCRDGWSQDDAREFLCEVCRHAGDEDRDKREKTVADSYRRAETGAKLQGWTSLAAHVGADVVGVVRKMFDPHSSAQKDFDSLFTEKEGVPDDWERAGTPERTEDLDEIEALEKTLGITWGEWDKPVEPPVYLVDQVVPEDAVGMIVAKGSSLKTWIILSIAAAVASGKPWLGHFSVKQARALIIDFESGTSILRERAQYLQHKDCPSLGHASFPNHRIDAPEFWSMLARVCIARGVGLVCIDSFAAGATGVDENDPRAAMPLQYASKFTEVANKSAVVIVHHGKKGDGGDERDVARGTGALYGACDWQFVLAPQNDERTKMVVHFNKQYRRPIEDFRLALTVDGLVLDIEAEGDAQRRQDGIRNAIRALLTRGPVLTKALVAKGAGKRFSDVTPELEGMIAGREVVLIPGRGFQLDNPIAREARVLSLLKGAVPVATVAQACKEAFVGTDEVNSMIAKGIVTKSGEGRLLAVDVC